MTRKSHLNKGELPHFVTLGASLAPVSGSWDRVAVPGRAADVAYSPSRPVYQGFLFRLGGGRTLMGG